MNRRPCSFLFAGLVAFAAAALNLNSAYADNPPADPPVERYQVDLVVPPAPAPAPAPAPPVINVQAPAAPAPIIVPGPEKTVVETKTEVKTEKVVQKAVPVGMLFDASCLVSLDQAAKCGVGLDLSFPTGWDKLNVHLIGDIGPGGTPGFGAGFTGMLRLETPFVIGTVTQEVKDKSGGVVKKAKLQVTFRLIAAAGADFGELKGTRSIVFAPGAGFAFLCDDLVEIGIAYLEGVGLRSGPVNKPPTWMVGDERMFLVSLKFLLFK